MRLESQKTDVTLGLSGNGDAKKIKYQQEFDANWLKYPRYRVKEGLNGTPMSDIVYVYIHICIFIYKYVIYRFVADTRPSVFHLHGVGWYAIVEIPVDWFSARNVCLQMGGYLASVESNNENDDLEGFVKQHGNI